VTVSRRDADVNPDCAVPHMRPQALPVAKFEIRIPINLGSI
jgi:hypothetical protein